jgi:aminoglycoside phosphotransferase family enzyme/predicted kinase
MEIDRLIAALSDPVAYPLPVDAVEVRQTHISVVFLAGSRVYKVKKAVELGFVDYSTLGSRRHHCEQEVRLNRRLGPSVYLGVVPITRDGDVLRVGGHGEVIEWAVEMERLPDEAMLRERLRHGMVGPEVVEALARRVADFHARADGGPAVAAYGRFEVVSGNARENFEQAAAHVGTGLSRGVFERLRKRTEEALAALRPLIEGRAERGVPRDGHGDLRLDHVYLFPDRPPPADLVVIDGIEFNERFRCADPVADTAFLVMDLAFHSRRDLAAAFADAYFRAAGDAEGRTLLPFYTAYRAAVRGKVEGIKGSEPEVPGSERAAALVRARAYWLLALGELEDADRRPCLILVGGLPGAGKSTLARGLTGPAGLQVIRSDLVRRELGGLADDEVARSPFETGIYSPEWAERTYAECLRRAEALLFEGRRALVDASFRSEASRRLFLETAARWGVPALLLLCRADPEVVQARLRQRQSDASDADWSIHLKIAERWEEPGPLTRPAARMIDTSGEAAEALSLATEALRGLGLVGRTGARIRG